MVCKMTMATFKKYYFLVLIKTSKYRSQFIGDSVWIKNLKFLC